MTDVTVKFTAEQYERLLGFTQSHLTSVLDPLVRGDELNKRTYPMSWQSSNEDKLQRHLEAQRLYEGIVAALRAARSAEEPVG